MNGTSALVTSGTIDMVALVVVSLITTSTLSSSRRLVAVGLVGVAARRSARLSWRPSTPLLAEPSIRAAASELGSLRKAAGLDRKSTEADLDRIKRRRRRWRSRVKGCAHDFLDGELHGLVPLSTGQIFRAAWDGCRTRAWSFAGQRARQRVGPSTMTLVEMPMTVLM